MTFAELLEEIKNLSPSEKATLRGLLSEDLLNQEEGEELLAQLDADVAADGAGNSVYTIEETREMVRNVVALARRYRHV
jgi:hypothetical protein